MGWRIAILLVLGSLLSGCNNSNIRSSQNDQTGDQGEVRRTSPAEVYMNLAAEYLRKKRYEVALKTAKKGLAVDSYHSGTHYVIGLVYQVLAEDELAERHFYRAVDLDDHNAYALNALGSFLCNKERYDEAQVYFDKAVSNPLYETPWIAMTNAGLCSLANKQTDKGEIYFRKALNSNKTYAPALLEMAKLKLAQKKYLPTRAYLQRFSAVSKHSAESLWVGTVSETALGDRGAAASYKLFLLSDFPDSDEATRLSE